MQCKRHSPIETEKPVGVRIGGETWAQKTQEIEETLFGGSGRVVGSDKEGLMAYL